MANQIYQFVIPNIFFFVVIFLIFFLLETFVVLFLIWLEHKKHDWLMFFILRCYRYYRKVRLVFRIAGLLILAGVLLIISPYLAVSAPKPHTTILALAMLVMITLVYIVLTHIKGRLSIRRRGDKALYLILSMILYFFILLLINYKFPEYRQYVYKNVVSPVVVSAEKQLDANKKESLLNEFRAMVKNGQCPYKNYHDEKNTDIIHNFLYITTDVDLITRKGPMIPSASADINGKNCTNGQETFLLTESGEWYWVTSAAK